MLKSILFAGAAMIAMPAIAQTTTAPAPDPMADPAPTTAPVPTDPISTEPITTEPLAPASTAPLPEQADPVTSATEQTAPVTPTEPAPTAPAEAAAQGTAATPTQVAQIVDKEFPAYDKDATSDLNEAEFAAWMKTLRKSTEPALDTESAEVATWIGQAFAAADKDSSKTVTKIELTGFLTQAPA